MMQQYDTKEMETTGKIEKTKEGFYQDDKKWHSRKKTIALVLLAPIMGAFSEGAEHFSGASLMASKITMSEFWRKHGLELKIKSVDSSCSTTAEEYRLLKNRAKQLLNGSDVEVWNFSKVRDAAAFDEGMSVLYGDAARKWAT
jgi:hypothetical protein